MGQIIRNGVRFGSIAATGITFDNTESSLSSLNVQDAIVELDTNKVDKEAGKGLFSGDYNDLNNKPNLSTVATSGDYNDLSNKPSIPAAVAVKGNAESSYRTGNVNLTPANIGAIATSDRGGTVIQVDRGASHTTAQSGYWAAMCNSNSGGSPVLPSSNKWWHVLSMDWSGSDVRNWVSQLAIPTQDGDNHLYLRCNTAGSSIDSKGWTKVANSGDIPSVGNGTLTIQQNGTTKATFTANQSGNATANITVPTNNNQLTNGAGYITSSGSCNYANGAGWSTGLKDGDNWWCFMGQDKSPMIRGYGHGIIIQPNTEWWLTMQADGNLVVYQNSVPKWNSGTSSRRFKHNIKDMTEERARKILDIRPVTFDWNDDQPATTRQNDNAGVIAEEVSQVIPDLVVYEDTEDGEKIERRVEYERFTPYLIKMIQMQQKQIDEQQKEIELLKQHIMKE